MEQGALSSTMGTHGGGTRSPGRYQQQTARLVGPRKSESQSGGVVGREKQLFLLEVVRGFGAVQLLFPPPRSRHRLS